MIGGIAIVLCVCAFIACLIGILSWNIKRRNKVQDNNQDLPSPHDTYQLHLLTQLENRDDMRLRHETEKLVRLVLLGYEYQLLNDQIPGWTLLRKTSAMQLVLLRQKLVETGWKVEFFPMGRDIAVYVRPSDEILAAYLAREKPAPLNRANALQ